jgi:probable phosphoglycerate mutase
MNQFCNIYLVRHGKTDWNSQKLLQGHTDIALNNEGKLAAVELSKKLKNLKFDLIFSSDLLRAKETAEIIANEHDIKVQTDESLRERRFGSFEGKPHDSIIEVDEILAKLSDEERYVYKHEDEIESDKEVMDRFLVFLKHVSKLNLGKTVLMVTHGGTMRAFLTKLGVINKDRRKISIGNLSYVNFDSDGENFNVKEMVGIIVKE